MTTINEELSTTDQQQQEVSFLAECKQDVLTDKQRIKQEKAEMKLKQEQEKQRLKQEKAEIKLKQDEEKQRLKQEKAEIKLKQDEEREQEKHRLKQEKEEMKLKEEEEKEMRRNEKIRLEQEKQQKLETLRELDKQRRLNQKERKECDFSGDLQYEDMFNYINVDNELEQEEIIEYLRQNGSKLFGFYTHGKGSIIKKENDPEKPRITLLEFGDVKLKTIKYVISSTGVEKKILQRSLYDYLCSIGLPTYSGLTFNPKFENHYRDAITNTYVFNTFRGFALNKESIRVNVNDIDRNLIQKILDFIKNIICNENEIIYDYVIKWIAHILQKPWLKTGVCIYLYSKEEGTGKGTFVSIVKALVGKENFFKSANILDFVGHFNNHLKNIIVGNYDEGKAINPDKKDNDLIKNLMTEDTRAYTSKGKDTVGEVKDFLNIIGCGNNELIGACSSNTDRRYELIETSNKLCKHITDKPEDIIRNKEIEVYLKDLYDDIENTDIQLHLFAYFYNMDLSNFNVKSPPITDLRKRVMEKSQNTIDNDFINQLREGHFYNLIQTLYNSNYENKMFNVVDKNKIKTGEQVSMKYWVDSITIRARLYIPYYEENGSKMGFKKSAIGLREFMENNGFKSYHYENTKTHSRKHYFSLNFNGSGIENSITLGKPNTSLIQSLDQITSDEE